MNPPRIPKPLFILEMANNHMGSLEHGLKLVAAFAEVCRPFPFHFAFKLQYRHLDSFIHPDYQGRSDLKYVKRFQETRLTREAFKTLVAHIRACGFLAVCTPFDETSVGWVEEDGFDILKIASCSLTDWPLLERVAKTALPVIASTATASTEEMDSVVSFLTHRSKEFALLHCVAEYPTPPEKIQLNQIDFLRNRYPQTPIGYSTHEPPASLASLPMVIAKGATILEKHVALPTPEYPVNAYSSTPEEYRRWLEAAVAALALCGGSAEQRAHPTAGELSSLHGLRRGAFATREIPAGTRLTDQDLFFAIPCQEGQVTANDWSKYRLFTTQEPLVAGAPVLFAHTSHVNARQKIHEIVTEVSRMLRKGHIMVPGAAELEISHHYGLERFHENGATMITVINRQYCKKLIVLLPGQNHPEHYHKLKDETFYVLHGTLYITLEGEEKEIQAGQIITVSNGVSHSFRSTEGVVFEEVSTTHFGNDSFYTDPTIQTNPHRKTYQTYWLSSNGTAELD